MFFFHSTTISSDWLCLILLLPNWSWNTIFRRPESNLAPSSHRACQMFSVSWSFLSPFSPRFGLVHLYADAHDTLSLLPFCLVDGNIGASAGLPACNVSGRFLKLSFSRRQRLVSQLQIWRFHPWCLFVHFFASFLTSSLLCHHKLQSATCGPTLALVHGNDVSKDLAKSELHRRSYNSGIAMGTARLRCSEWRAADTHADHGWGAIRLWTSWSMNAAIGRISTLTNFTLPSKFIYMKPWLVTLVYSVCLLLFPFRGLWPSSAVLNFGFVFSFREIDREELQLCFVATRSSWHPSQCHGGCQKRHWRDGTAIKTRCLEFKSDWKNAWRLFEHVSIHGEEHFEFFCIFPFQFWCVPDSSPLPFTCTSRWQRHEGFKDFLQLHSSGGKMSILRRMHNDALEISKDSNFYELLYDYIIRLTHKHSTYMWCWLGQVDALHLALDCCILRLLSQTFCEAFQTTHDQHTFTFPPIIVWHFIIPHESSWWVHV